MDKNSDFYKKYSKDLENKELVTTFLKNDVNDVKIILDKEKVTLLSEGSINLVDAQLNELLLKSRNTFMMLETKDIIFPTDTTDCFVNNTFYTQDLRIRTLDTNLISAKSEQKWRLK